MDFRQIDGAEVADAYALYVEVFEWLKAKRVRQWLCPVPRDAFADRQRAGELFGLLADGRLAAVVTLAFESNSSWATQIGCERHGWIMTLAVARQYRGAGIGRHVMARSEAHLKNVGAADAYLDCVDAGFLPTYYARLGYEVLGRKEITYPSCNTFPMVLMRKGLSEIPLTAGTVIEPKTDTGHAVTDALDNRSPAGEPPAPMVGEEPNSYWSAPELLTFPTLFGRTLVRPSGLHSFPSPDSA
jgi:ribosomal protein S18 acetylase RimI-like enzyme